MGDKLDFNFRYVKRDADAPTRTTRLIGEEDLSPDQITAYKEVVEWMAHPTPRRTLGGYAGTGKSTLLALLACAYPHKNLAFCAFTGKATGELRRKIFLGAASSHYIGTIHAMMYTPVVVDGAAVGWKKRETLPYDIIVVDEASMVDEGLYTDLASYGIPIFAVGDHGQLPPVFGHFNLMEAPDLRLEKIHRQAEGNPILQLSAHIREHGDLPNGLMNQGQIKYLGRSQLPALLRDLYTTPDLDLSNAAVLCYLNKTRVGINALARQFRFPDADLSVPNVGDQVLCLRNAENTVYNGMRGDLRKIRRYTNSQDLYHGVVRFADDEIEFEGPINKHQFSHPKTFQSFEELESFGMKGLTEWEQIGMLFDYGYSLTVHKAQGSAFECVVLVYERPRNASDDDFKRWLYTGVTRCSDMLFVVLPD